MSTAVIEAQQGLEEEEDGVVLTPEEEEWFDEMIAETDEQIRAGRFHTVEEIRAMLRTRR